MHGSFNWPAPLLSQALKQPVVVLRGLRHALALALPERLAPLIVPDSADTPSSRRIARSNNGSAEHNSETQPQLKVAMLMREFYPLVGGYQNQALRLAEEMSKRNICIHVVTHRNKILCPYEVHNQIKIHRVPALQAGHLSAFSFLASSFWWMARNRHEFQLIHANRSSSGLIAGLIGFVLRKKVLYKLTRGDEIDVKGFRRTLWGRLKLHFLKCTVDRFVAITKQIEDDLKRLGVPGSKIVRIPNGISMDPLSNGYDREQIKSEMGWASDTKVVTFVGRLVHAKGVDWLLEVWREVAKQERTARLAIIGDGTERRALEAQVRTLGIADTVDFLGAQKDVWRFLAATDVFVLPSRQEGVSNALLEAMSRGLPAIVADDYLGGNREVVDNGKDGYVIEFGDTRNFSQSLVRLLREPALRKSMGTRARQKVEQRSSIESVADSYCKTYSELLADSANAETTRKKPSIGLFLPRPDRSYHMAKKLRERGFQVVHYNTEGYKDDAWIKVRNGFLPTLAHLLFRTNQDVYFASLNFVPSFDLYLNKLLRRKPYVFNSTGVHAAMYKDRSKGKPWPKFFERYYYPFLLDRTFAGASKIVCNSRFLESLLADEYPRYRARMMTIYNGIDFDRYSSGHRQSIPGVREGDLILMCVTSVNYENKTKGFQLVLDAFGHVLAKRNGVKLVVAATSADPLHRQSTDRYLRSKPWNKSVVLFYNHKNIPDLLASADIFVYATPNNSNDSLPRALLEAQSAGLPAVTTDTTGCAEIVRDGITGFVVPYEATAMAEKTLELLDDAALRRDMGKAAQEWILKTFNWDRMAEQYANIFLKIGGQEDASVSTNA
jgi:glycosyltransferase involved in cell wall biosynthesis